MAKKKAAADDRQRRLEAASADVQKRFGDRASRIGTQAAASLEYVETGSIALDAALGGGFIRGRIYELFGMESVGKSTLAWTAAGRCQANGGLVAFIDLERSTDWEYIKRLGVDHDLMLYDEPDDAESALETVRSHVQHGIDLIIIDTVAALAPSAELKGEMGDIQMGLQARLMSKAMRMLTSEVKKTEVVVLFVNQVREKIGMVWGDPETTPGGRALKFYSSGRIRMRPGESIKEGDKVVGRWVKAYLKKSKQSVPLQTVQFPIVFGEGIDSALEVLDEAVTSGVIDRKKQGWLHWGDLKWRGVAAFRKAAAEDADLIPKIRKEVQACRA